MNDRAKEKPSMESTIKKLTLQDLAEGYRLVRADRARRYRAPISAKAWIKKGMFTTSRTAYRKKMV